MKNQERAIKKFQKIPNRDSIYRCYTNEKVVDMPKSRAQFTPMRTTEANSRTKIVITLDYHIPQETRRESTACRTKDLK
jgi:hypothetical protein